MEIYALAAEGADARWVRGKKGQYPQTHMGTSSISDAVAG